MIRMLALSLAMVSPIGMASADSLTPQQFERAMVDAHNAARSAVGVPPVTWDPRLAAAAQSWANHLAQTRKLEHDPRRGDMGENLASGTAGYYTPAELVGLWVAEKAGFVNKPIPNAAIKGAATGHYTQIVWRYTTRVGCAMATGGDIDFLVCRYSPMGNMVGEKAF